MPGSGGRWPHEASVGVHRAEGSAVMLGAWRVMTLAVACGYCRRCPSPPPSASGVRDYPGQPDCLLLAELVGPAPPTCTSQQMTPAFRNGLISDLGTRLNTVGVTSASCRHVTCVVNGDRVGVLAAGHCSEGLTVGQALAVGHAGEGCRISMQGWCARLLLSGHQPQVGDCQCTHSASTSVSREV